MTKRIECWPYVPNNPNPKFAQAFWNIHEHAKKLWPNVKLGYVGHDGATCFMQERGNPEPFTFGLAGVVPLPR